MLCHAKLRQGDIGRTSGGECVLSAPPETLFAEMNVLVNIKQISFQDERKKPQKNNVLTTTKIQIKMLLVKKKI